MALGLGHSRRPAELCIPRTQAGRVGSGPGAHRPSSRAFAHSFSPVRRSTPSIYAVTTATGPRDRVQCLPGGQQPAPARVRTALSHHTWPLTWPLAGPVPRARARRLRAGLGVLRALTLTRTGGLVPLDPGHGVTRATRGVLDRESVSPTTPAALTALVLGLGRSRRPLSPSSRTWLRARRSELSPGRPQLTATAVVPPHWGRWPSSWPVS